MTVFQRDSFQAVVHDLRGPMTVIKGYVQLLLAGMAGPMSEDQKKLLKRSVGPLEELILMTDNLMQTMNLEKDEFQLKQEAVDLDQMLGDMVSFYEMPFTQRHITLTHEGWPSNTFVRADPFWLRRVLHNLIWNAFKYTPDGGTVSLSVNIEAHPGREGLTISVKDSGLGIPSTKLQQIFEKFKQVRSSDMKTGTGLGLWICRRVMELHGGRITVDSAPGHGSRFILWFPPTHIL